MAEPINDGDEVAYTIGEVVEESESAINKDSYWLGNIEVIKKSQLKQLNDPKCEHNWKLDPSDESDHWYSIKCTKCIVGKLMKKIEGEPIPKQFV